jgi:hypothetical protein
MKMQVRGKSNVASWIVSQWFLLYNLSYSSNRPDLPNQRMRSFAEHRNRKPPMVGSGERSIRTTRRLFSFAHITVPNVVVVVVVAIVAISLELSLELSIGAIRSSREHTPITLCTLP